MDIIFIYILIVNIFFLNKNKFEEINKSRSLI